MLLALVNMEIVLAPPPVVVTFDETGGRAVAALVLLLFATLAAASLFPPTGAAITKAEAGSPPKVCASPAFSAYGTLSNSTRACSASPCAWIPSQRASPETNTSVGSPSLRDDPSITE